MQKLILKERDPSASAGPKRSGAPAVEAGLLASLTWCVSWGWGICVQVGEVIGTCFPIHPTQRASLLNPSQGLYKDKPRLPCGWACWSLGATGMILFFSFLNINVWLPLAHTPLGTCPATQACALDWELNWQLFGSQATTQ